MLEINPGHLILETRLTREESTQYQEGNPHVFPPESKQGLIRVEKEEVGTFLLQGKMLQRITAPPSSQFNFLPTLINADFSSQPTCQY